MKSEIQNIKMAFVCRENWDDMILADGGRFCNACNKKVYDFTDAKVQQFLQIMSENDNHICGRFRKDQVAPPTLPTWKKYLSAALILIGINIFNVRAQDRPGTSKTDTIQQEMLFGIPIMQTDASFPRGQEAFTSFLHKNLQYKKGMIAGKVFASFTIKKDGSTTDIKILRGLNELNNNEAIRVLKMMPKWKPAQRNGKQIEQEYVVPIEFK